jgi:copper chaperone
MSIEPVRVRVKELWAVRRTLRQSKGGRVAVSKKHAVRGAIVALILTVVVTASAAVRSITIKIQGMTCGGCATRVEEALKSTDGVLEVRVSFERGRAVVKYDDQKVAADKLREVVQSTGFFCEVKP